MNGYGEENAGGPLATLSDRRVRQGTCDGIGIWQQTAPTHLNEEKGNARASLQGTRYRSLQTAGGETDLENTLTFLSGACVCVHACGAVYWSFFHVIAAALYRNFVRPSVRIWAFACI